MLELRPNCEHCNKSLPANSNEAMICSFECTFCNTCVDEVLKNVCPNCGGGFCQRPIRPKKNWRDNNYLGKYPASEKLISKPISPDEHNEFAGKLSDISPSER